jgi:hypothetical protein
MREATAVIGVLVGVIVAFTLLAGGRLSLGTSTSGPYASFGFTGPQSR